MTEADILKIVSSKELEPLTLELKSRRIFENSDGKEKIACEIIALANKHGGRLILGLNDDGSFDGKMEPKEVDKLKELISQICRDKISPIVDSTTELIECSQGDVLAVYIPKKRSIPHAFIPKKDGQIIRSRVYYIRTIHGKRLATDTELSWLFNYEDTANFTDKFRIAIEHDALMNSVGCDKPWGNSSFSKFTSHMKDKDIKSYFDNSLNYYDFWQQLIPFAILESVFCYYSTHWYIGTELDFGRRYSGPMIGSENISCKKIRVSDIPHTGLNHILLYPWDFSQVLDVIFPEPISIPQEAEISISVEKSLSLIKLEHPSFKFEIRIGMLQGGSGAHPLNPWYQIVKSRFGFQAANDYGNGCWYYDGAGYFVADFDFPEHDYVSYERYHHYAKSLSDLLRYNWDYNAKRSELPSTDSLVMHNKVDDILRILQLT